MTDAITQIMEYAHKKLEPTKLNFALILWRPGCPNGLQSVGISTVEGVGSEEVLRALTFVSAPLIGADPNASAAKVLNDAAQRPNVSVTADGSKEQSRHVEREEE